MRKKALRKDFFMEIRNSLNRFLSIFFIVALGVAFFAGIRATNPDMRRTADSYFDDSNLMDVRVLSTLGLTEADVKAIRQVKGIETVEPAYSADVLCDANGNELVVHAMSLTRKLNRITVSQGRLPEKEDEVLADPFFITSTGYHIGDKIRLSSGADQKLSDSLKRNSFTIVGIGSTPYYLSFQRGSASIGNGKINSFLVFLPGVFQMDVYTTVYASVSGAKEQTAYSDEYDKMVKDSVNNIKDIADARCGERYDELYRTASDQIEKSKTELAKQKKKAEEESKATLTALQSAGLSKEELQASMKKMENANAGANQKFAEAQTKITEAENKLNQLEKPVWYVLDRDSVEAYVEFEQNADRIGAIGKIFPAFFFLVAALICLTTMTRMVEEERMQIGILKALGYSKISIAMKYVLYALFATLGGGLAGAAIGLKVLPMVIITAYKILYPGIPKVLTPFNLYYATLATALSVFCTELATFLACYKELLSKPSNLMRPEAPKAGKRVLLERIPFLWKHLNFTWKATVRNLVRYKKRFFMTIFGIGGCMALLLVGFGLKDSIFVIYTRQFDEIVIYDASVSLESKASAAEKEKLQKEIENNSAIASSLQVRSSSAEISYHGKTKTITLYVPEKPEKLEDYIVLRSRIGHKSYTLDNNGLILTEQIAKKLGVSAGDTITIKEGKQNAEVKIAGITENYMTHFGYMTPELYKSTFEKKVNYNEYFLLMSGLGEEDQLKVGNSLLKLPAANGVFYNSYYQKLLSNILKSLNIVVWVLIIAAGALAFVVLYNLNNININERRRELATIKVLGFYQNEMAAYVYRENIILTVIGTAFGILFGIVLHRYVIVTVEIDLVMFGRNIDLSSYMYSVLLTFLFSAFVNLVMFYKLKKIDMVESLKSVE